MGDYRLLLSPHPEKEPRLESVPPSAFTLPLAGRTGHVSPLPLVAADEQNPIIAGEPRTAFVPYQRTFFTCERRGGTYIVTEVRYIAHGKERQARFSAFNEIIPGYYRPQQLVVTVEEGRTEVRFQHWTASNTAEARVFTPIHLETQALTLPAK